MSIGGDVMRMPRVRFSVRRMMVMLAVVAIDLAPFAWTLASLQNESAGVLNRFTNAMSWVGLVYLEFYLILFQAIALFLWLTCRNHLAPAGPTRHA